MSELRVFYPGDKIECDFILENGCDISNGPIGEGIYFHMDKKKVRF